MILIINEKAGLAHAVRTTLSNAGYTTILAHSAEAAIEQISHERPALILLGDTEASLLQASNLLRSHPMTQHVPIIVQSDDFSLLNEEYLYRLGAQGVLSGQSSGRLLHELNQLLAKN